mmetsp:Transcript_101619/g.270263  ORF Transcript_101619/g.270263 Transcript_101619/m.270263 type:complete len:227 (+) Transcript_101619:212-892(+)
MPEEGDELQGHGGGAEAAVGGKAVPHKLPLLSATAPVLVHHHELRRELPGVQPAVEEAPRHLPRNREGVQGQGDDQQRYPCQQESDAVRAVGEACGLWEFLLVALLADPRHDAPLLQHCAEELGLRTPKEDEEDYHVDEGNLGQHQEHRSGPGDPGRPVTSPDEEPSLGLQGKAEEEAHRQRGGEDGHEDGADDLLPQGRPLQEVKKASYDVVEAHGTKGGRRAAS